MERPVRRRRRYGERRGLRPGALIAVILALVLIAAGFGYFALNRSRNVSKTTSFGLKNIGELATQAGYFTTVQSISKARELWGWEVPLTQSNYVYSYDGTIKAGVDFGEIETEVDEAKHVITVRFPEFRILSTEIDEDSFKIYNDGTNLFTTLRVEDVNRSNAELKNEAKQTALNNGILENARANAEALVKGYLAGMYDLSVYTIQFLP